MTENIIHEIIPADDARLKAWGTKLFARECIFTAGANNEGALPPPGLPEVAFAGRSNVGKSSLVNALTGRKTLARVSHTPGRTQQLNFFDLGGFISLVDLPGYGYAAVGKKQKLNWEELIHSYLKGRVTLRRVCVLIDSRHGLKPIDTDIFGLLNDAAVPFQIVLTKTDELRAGELEARIADLAPKLKKHPAAFPGIAATSAKNGFGIEYLRASIAALTTPPPEFAA